MAFGSGAGKHEEEAQPLRFDVEAQSSPPAPGSRQAANMPAAPTAQPAQAAKHMSTSCMVTVYAVAIAVLLWAAFPHSSDRIWHHAQQAASHIHSAVGLGGPVAVCPLPYERMRFDDVAAGSRPYLFGAQPAGCEPCRRGYNEASLTAEDHHYCEFWSQNWAPEPWGRQVCPLWLQHALLNDWIERRWAAPLTLTPCDLWRFLGPANGFPGRTLWVIGDSQSASLYEALKCFLHGFLTDVSASSGPGMDTFEAPPLDVASLDKDLQARAAKVDMACKTLGPAGSGAADAGGRVCYLRGDIWTHIHENVLPLLRAAGANRRDIMVVNTGLHFSETYENDVKALVHYWHQAKVELPFFVWKDTPTQHFDQDHGEWPSGGKPPFTCKPIAGGYINVTNSHQLVSTYIGQEQQWLTAVEDISRGGWRNEQAGAVMTTAGVAVSATWNETLPLDQYHRDNGAGYECTHYCAPSAPQVWVHGLVQTLRSHTRRLNAHFGAAELTGIPAAEWPA